MASHNPIRTTPEPPPGAPVTALDAATQRVLVAELIEELSAEAATGTPTVVAAEAATVPLECLLRRLRRDPPH